MRRITWTGWPHRRAREGRGLCVVLIVVALTATACGNWWQLGGSESRSGYQPYEFSINPTNVASLTEHWSAFIGGFHGEEGAPSSPLVADGVTYEGYAGGLQAFDAAGDTGCTGQPKTCTPLWTARTGYLEASPVVAAGRVYTVSSDGVLSA